MSILLGLRHIIRSIVDRGGADAETREELAFHVERQTQKHIAAGMSPADAARRAALEMGGVERWRDETRDVRRGSAMHDFIGDTRYTLRGLISRPGFALSALATLAVGIGACTAIFAVARGALLAPLPFPDADRLMSIVLRMPQGPAAAIDMVWSYPKFTVLRGRQNAFSSLALHSSETVVVTGIEGSDGAERLSGEMASASYFDMLGARPALGRTFTPDEDAVGGPSSVVVLSDAMWRTRFGARRTVVGEGITLAGVKRTIVGVMPPEFRGLSGDALFWIPVPGARSLESLQAAGAHNMQLVGRVADRVPPDAARQAVEALGREIDAAYPDELHWGATAYSLDDIRVNATIRRSIRLLVVAVTLLLLIVCVNLTTLLVTRGAVRQREFAVRIALGAGRARLMRQLMTESFVLAGIGGLAGGLVAVVAVRVLASTLPLAMPTLSSGTDLTRLTFTRISLDMTAVGFAMALTALLGVGIGLASALRITRGQLALVLRQGASSAIAPTGFVPRNALVIAQIALAVVFLVASGLTIQSLRRALSIPLGYSPNGLMSVKMTLDPVRASRDSNGVLWREVLENVRALPGVAGSGVVSCAPVGMHCDGTTIVPDGRTGSTRVMYLTASPEYFAVLGTPLLRGRVFRREDESPNARVMIVNKTAARVVWGGDDPLTHPVRSGNDLVTVIGIVDDARYGDIEQPPMPAAFFPHRGNRGVLFVRADGDPGAVARAVRGAVRRAGAGHAMNDMRPMSERLRDATARNRLSLQVFTSFAISALLLAAIGVYSTLALAVTQRTREFAIRRALGASASSLARAVSEQAAGIAIVGGVIGVAGAWVVARAMASLLYGVSAIEPAAYAGAAALLVVAIVTASAWPTIRTFRIDPKEAMRAE